MCSDDALRFYRMLFDYGLHNGMVGFEHDYLDYNFLAMPYLRRAKLLGMSVLSSLVALNPRLFLWR
eukprot:COSAG01_NODE_5522_length_4206_cov_6.215973_5_plen_66_part_00